MQENEFVTRELILGATLLTLGFELIGIDYQYERDRLVGYFKFKNNEMLQEANRKFMQRLLLVEPVAFQGNTRFLKSQTNNQQKSPQFAQDII